MHPTTTASTPEPGLRIAHGGGELRRKPWRITLRFHDGEHRQFNALATSSQHACELAWQSKGERWASISVIQLPQVACHAPAH